MSYRQYTLADFHVGQQVRVHADQGVRTGQVTALGRTRIKVRHPRNARGDMVERAYPLDRIAVGQAQRSGAWGVVTWGVVTAAGTWSRIGLRHAPWANLPVITDHE